MSGGHFGLGSFLIEDGLQDQESRFGHDLNVQPQADIAYIIRIPLVPAENTGESRSLSPAASDLGHSGDPGACEVAEFVISYNTGEFTGIFQHMGPGADDAHMSQENIDELGQFIEACMPQETADAGDPRIVPAGHAGIGSIVHIHGTELITPKSLSQEAHPFLPEEDRAPGIQLYKKHNNREGPGKKKQDDQ